MDEDGSGYTDIRARTEVNDLRAFRKAKFIEGLYKTHWYDLVGWLRRRYGAGPPEPEEIAQGAFAKLAELDTVENIRNPKAFLFTIAVNNMLMGIRWHKRTQRLIDAELKVSHQNVEEITPERIYSDEEQLERIVRQVKQLSPKQREILVRSRIQGQTYEQISAETGWSGADISRQLKAVMAHLRATANDGQDGSETGNG